MLKEKRTKRRFQHSSHYSRLSLVLVFHGRLDSGLARIRLEVDDDSADSGLLYRLLLKRVSGFEGQRNSCEDAR